jgi:hypothetical protein
MAGGDRANYVKKYGQYADAVIEARNKPPAWGAKPWVIRRRSPT